MQSLHRRRLSRRRAFRSLLGALPIVTFGFSHGRAQLKQPNPDESNERLKVMRGVAQSVRVIEISEGKKGPSALRPEPLVRYDDPPRGIVDGTLWGWGEGGRLIATLKVERWKSRPRGPWALCVSSFALVPLEITFGDGSVEGLRKPGWQPQTIADAPPQADSALQRLVQIKTLARRFSVSVHSVHNPTPLQLRLLPTPIDRYNDPASRIVDGAVFAFSFGTNPTVLLAIECVQKTRSESAWRFGFSRQGSGEMFARLDDTEVWTQPFALAQGDSDVYTSRTMPEPAFVR
jgi:hypothetical protein